MQAYRLQAWLRGPRSLVYMLQHSLQHVSYDDIVVVGKHAIRIFYDFQFSLFDFPHLSSFNACKELDHLIILYPPVPRTHEHWEGHCPPNFYGGAAFACSTCQLGRRARKNTLQTLRQDKGI